MSHSLRLSIFSLAVSLCIGASFVATTAVSEVEPPEKEAEGRYRYALQLLGEGKQDEAVLHLRYALQLDPTHTLCAVELGNIMTTRGEWTSSDYYFKQALLFGVDLGDAIYDIHYQLGLAHESLGAAAVAATHYCFSAKWDADRPNWGVAVVACARTSPTIQADRAAYFRAALERRPAGDKEVLSALAREHFLMRDFEKALVLYTKMSLLPPLHSPMDSYNIALTLSRLGRHEEALPYYEATYRASGGKTPWFSTAVDFFRTLEHAYEDAKQLNTPMAREVIARGVEEGVYRSRWQRSPTLDPQIRASPVWDPCEVHAGVAAALEAGWKTIRRELLAVMDSSSTRPQEWAGGEMSQLFFFHNGWQSSLARSLCPGTYAIVSKFADATTMVLGNIKFSVLKPGAHIHAHTGPTTTRIRVHLGLVVPKGCCNLRVADRFLEWKEGRVIAFDDSFEHEVWNNSTKKRGVLIVDLWHPDIPAERRLEMLRKDRGFVGGKAELIYNLTIQGEYPVFQGDSLDDFTTKNRQAADNPADFAEPIIEAHKDDL
jgi:hypothetical protein